MRGLAIGDFGVVASEDVESVFFIHVLRTCETGGATLRVQWVSEVILLMRHG